MSKQIIIEIEDVDYSNDKLKEEIDNLMSNFLVNKIEVRDK